MAVSERDDFLLQRSIPIRRWTVTVGTRAHPNDTERTAFAESLFDHVAHQITA